MSDARQAAEKILGPIDWQGDTHGLCRCPGEHLHNNATRPQDTTVFIDGLPNVFCFHQSCSTARWEANRELRRQISDKSAGLSGPVRIQRDPEAEMLSRLNTIAGDGGQWLDPIPWTASEIYESSPTPLPDSPDGDYALFLSLFRPDDTIWIGDITDSSPAHFRKQSAWSQLSSAPHPFTTGAVFKPEAEARKNEMVLARKYLVVESDVLDKDKVGSVFRLMRERFRMRLHAIVDTGGKSLHAWFEAPHTPLWEKQLLAFLVPMGIDKATFRASQPVRLPGAARGDKHQRLLWFSPEGVGGQMVEPAVALGLKPAPQDWPPIKSYDLLMSESIAEPKVIIDGALHQGCKLLLGGSSKAYKSWGLIDLAVSLHTGSEWWGLKCHPSRVLFVNFEIQEWSFRNRLMDVARAKNVADRIGDLAVWTLRGYAADLTVIRPIIEKHIDGKGYQAIILDPNYMLMGDRDENNAGDMGGLMNEFEHLAVRHNLSVFLSHHFAKGNASGKESIDRFSGSGVFARNPDSLVVLTAHEEDERTFSCDITLRNFPPMDSFVVQWGYPLFRVNHALNPDKLKRPGAHKAIDDDTFLTDMGSKAWQAGDLVRFFVKTHKISERTAYRYLNRLTKAGKILEESGLYRSEPSSF